MDLWRNAISRALSGRLVQSVLLLLYIIPLVGTLGQFWHTGFLLQTTKVSLLFWPGVDWSWTLPIPVWLMMGVMGALYIAGIAILFKRNTFAQASLFFLLFIIAAKLTGGLVNLLAGWEEQQTLAKMNLTGMANSLILALWYNPLWEEVVFRGIPFLVLLSLGKPISGRWKWAFILVPSLLFSLYHVPNHGLARIADTFLLGTGFAYATLRFGFFAPLILHMIADAMMVPSLTQVKYIPQNEIGWLLSNQWLIHSSWSIALLLCMIAIPATILWHRVRAAKPEIAANHENPRS